MGHLKTIVAAVLMGISSSSVLAAVVLEPTDFASGTDVSTAFPGVVLSNVPSTNTVVGVTIIDPLHQTPGATGPIFATGNKFSWRSDPPGLWDLAGAIRIDFANYADLVTVLYLPDDTDTGLLSVFGPTGERLADLVDRVSTTPFSLTFTASSTPVAYALASYGDAGFIGQIQYESARQTSEPATLAILTLGLAGLGFSRRKQ